MQYEELVRSGYNAVATTDQLQHSNGFAAVDGDARPAAALLLLIEGGAGAWWSSFEGLVNQWMAAQARLSPPHSSSPRVLAALFVSDAPADNVSANGVIEKVS